MQVTAQDSSQPRQTATCSFTVTVDDQSTPPPPSNGVGPQSTIQCPATRVDIWPGQSIQLIVNSNAVGTTFCLRAGVHQLTSSIRPKTGNTFVGEYGAVLDGTGWTTTDDTQGAFRRSQPGHRVRDHPESRDPQDAPLGHPCALPSVAVTGRSNTTRLPPTNRGIHFGPYSTIRNNYIHHNGIWRRLHRVYADYTTFDSNEIAYNGREQKVAGSAANVTFRNNFVHHNIGDGIWYDTNPNAGAVIEYNTVEDNGRNGIFFEASIGATISNNILRRNAWDAVFISMAQNAHIYNNWLEANFGGIDYFLNCFALSATDDVKNNAAYDNTVIIGTQSSTYASAFGSTGCTSTQLAPYLNGSKNLTFYRNAYRVPSLSFTQYFYWGGWKDWSQWQALGQDGGGSLSQ